MNRRSLLKAAAALTAGLVLPPTLAENAEVGRRFWALDQTMSQPGLPTGWQFFTRGPDHLGCYAVEYVALHDNGAQWCDRYDLYAFNTPAHPGPAPFRTVEAWAHEHRHLLERWGGSLA